MDKIVRLVDTFCGEEQCREFVDVMRRVIATAKLGLPNSAEDRLIDDCEEAANDLEAPFNVPPTQLDSGLVI